MDAELYLIPGWWGQLLWYTCWGLMGLTVLIMFYWIITSNE